MANTQMVLTEFDERHPMWSESIDPSLPWWTARVHAILAQNLVRFDGTGEKDAAIIRFAAYVHQGVLAQANNAAECIGNLVLLRMWHVRALEGAMRNAAPSTINKHVRSVNVIQDLTERLIVALADGNQ